MILERRISITFTIDIVILAATAPILYLSYRFPNWFPTIALVLLGIGWFLRKRRLGFYCRSTPIDLLLALLFLVMLPISLWAAPASLREIYSTPRSFILLWNLCLFYVVVIYSSSNRMLSEVTIGGFVFAVLIIAVLAPFTMDWIYKFSVIEMIVKLIPSLLRGDIEGAGGGIHPNQVGGSLVSVLPLMLAICYSDIRKYGRTLNSSLVSWLIWISTPIVGSVLLLTQSRSAWLALTVSVMIMTLIRYRWGRRILILIAMTVVIGSKFVSPAIVDMFGDTSTAKALGGTATLGFRQDVWTYALKAIAGFQFTGMGLGTFRELLFDLYPTSISPQYNLGHAHNVFLQTGLDFGLPGLILFIAILLLAFVQLYVLYQSRGSFLSTDCSRMLAIGLLGCLSAYVIFGMLDAISMGSKTNFVFWYLLGLIFGLSMLNRSCSSITTPS